MFLISALFAASSSYATRVDILLKVEFSSWLLTEGQKVDEEKKKKRKKKRKIEASMRSEREAGGDGREK